MVVYSFSNTVYGVGDFFLVEKKVFSVRKRSQEIINVTKAELSPYSILYQWQASFCPHFAQARSERSRLRMRPLCAGV